MSSLFSLAAVYSYKPEIKEGTIKWWIIGIHLHLKLQ